MAEPNAFPLPYHHNISLLVDNLESERISYLYMDAHVIHKIIIIPTYCNNHNTKS